MALEKPKNQLDDGLDHQPSPLTVTAAAEKLDVALGAVGLSRDKSGAELQEIDRGVRRAGNQAKRGVLKNVQQYKQEATSLSPRKCQDA